MVAVPPPVCIKLMRAKTAERGYGKAHRRLREEWAPSVGRGEVACARCGHLIAPGVAWDLGHHDLDRSVYVGPEHSKCNRGASMKRTNRRRVRRVSQVW
jgi:hypothetical protein